MRYRRVKQLAAVVVLAMVAAALLHVCHKDTPEEQVRRVVLAVRKGVEDKDVKQVLPHLSQNYRDRHGNKSETVKGMLLYYFMQHRKIAVLLTDLDISIEDSSAAARFQAVLSGRTGIGAGTVLPEALSAYRFEVSFIQESGTWLVSAANWERIVR